MILTGNISYHNHTTMEYKLEDGFPVPAIRAIKDEFKILAQTIQVGQSFSFGLEDLRRVQPRFSRYKKMNPGFNYMVRQQPDGTYRLWRTA